MYKAQSSFFVLPSFSFKSFVNDDRRAIIIRTLHHAVFSSLHSFCFLYLFILLSFYALSLFGFHSSSNKLISAIHLISSTTEYYHSIISSTLIFTNAQPKFIYPFQKKKILFIHIFLSQIVSRNKGFIETPFLRLS